MGVMRKASAAQRSVTLTSLTRRFDQFSGERRGTGVTRPTQWDDNPGVSSGTGMSRRRVSPATSAYMAIISA